VASFTVQTIEPACISSEDATSITISRCAEEVKDGDLVHCTDLNGLEVKFYTSTIRAIKLLNYTDLTETIVAIPADQARFCEPEVVQCGSGTITTCDPCVEPIT
jgi:hypothetical protein